MSCLENWLPWGVALATLGYLYEQILAVVSVSWQDRIEHPEDRWIHIIQSNGVVHSVYRCMDSTCNSSRAISACILLWKLTKAIGYSERAEGGGRKRERGKERGREDIKPISTNYNIEVHSIICRCIYMTS